MNAKTAKENGSGEPSSQSVSRIERRSRFGRTLLLAGVFALMAMIYVPTPGGLYHVGGITQYYSGRYRLIFDSSDTSVTFFQLVVNVAFAALLGCRAQRNSRSCGIKFPKLMRLRCAVGSVASIYD